MTLPEIDPDALFDVAGKSAIVIGATGAFGQVACVTLGKAGAKLTVTAGNSAELDGLVANLAAAGIAAIPVNRRPTDAATCDEIVAAAIDAHGGIDILVVAAGMNDVALIVDMAPERFARVMSANVDGAWLIARAVGKAMIARGHGGKIVFTSSARGKLGHPAGYSAYCTSKSAVDGMTRALGCEWGRHGITVNALAPTVFRSPLTAWMFADDDAAKKVRDGFLARVPVGRLGEPEDLAGPLLFLCSRASDFHTGHIVYADGGYTGGLGVAATVIITCAVTGGIHTPSLSDALPWRPEDIAAQAIAAAEAGAAILHLHARSPIDGSPTGDPAIYRQFLPAIHDATDAVINLTTGGSPNMSPDERLAAALAFSPEMCSLNMGSMNFAFHGLAASQRPWRFDWEERYIRASESFIFRNTFADIARTYALLADHGTRFEHECYDIGHLYNLAYFVDQGIAKPPLFIQSVFGILGGIGADPDAVVFMRRTADRLFGTDYIWSVLAAGRHQMPVATQAALLGGNVRVGLEDSLFLGRGRMAGSNAEQVTKVRTILAELGLEAASPAEARARLALKGRDAVEIT